MTLELAPYESRIVVFSDARLSSPDPNRDEQGRMAGDLTRGWKVRFPMLGKNSEALSDFDAPTSWTEDDRTRFYSGEVIYAKTFSLTDADMHRAKTRWLDFGQGTPVAADPKIRSGMRALLESPVRESAVVIVNGIRVGSVWHPPYSIDITSALHVGSNSIELRVGNTAINVLAGRAPADYRLLWGRYGQRFVPQDMEHLEPLPSGILGMVHLMETP